MSAFSAALIQKTPTLTARTKHMENELPGNPFIDEAARDDYETADGSGNAYATLALAYEQRTANLIAILGGSEVAIFAEEHLVDERYWPLLVELKERLGLA